MRIVIITLLAFVSTVASAQLSRSFTQDFVARVGLAEEFAIFLVEDIEDGKLFSQSIFLVEDIEVPNGVKQELNEKVFNANHTLLAAIPRDSAFTFTEPGMYLVLPFRGDTIMSFGTHMVMNEDYIDFFVTGKGFATITDDVVISDITHAIGRENIPTLCQALWEQ